MLLSIVIPVYNTKEYLDGCVQSILRNDTSDCEILLIDDGSTDGVCPELCDQLAQQSPHLIRVIHQANQGLGGARNTGLEAAAGEYIFFPDSDDKITPDALQVIKNAIRETGAQVIAFDFCSDDGNGTLTPMQASQFHSNDPFSLDQRPEFLLSLPSAWSRVWKRSLFLDSGIRYPSRVWYEDLRTSMKLFALAESIVALPQHLYLYLQRPGSIMRSSNIGRNREILDAFDDLLNWFQAQGLLQRYQHQLCRLCVDHVYIAASVRVLSADPAHSLLKEFADYLNQHFPDYRDNPYLSQLSPFRKLVLKLLNWKQYKLLRLLFRIKG